MTDYDDPNPRTRNVRSKPVKNNADPTQQAALSMLLARLTRWEQSNPTYQEMCRKATERVMGQ